MSPVQIEQAMKTAVAHHQSGRLGDAEALYRQVLAADPKHPDALHLLGVIAGQSGRDDLATDLIRQAIALRPDNPVFLRNLGLYMQTQDQLDQAIACYKRAIELAPKSARPWESLGWALRCMGRFDEAADCFHRALELDPKLGAAHQNLAYIRQQLAKPTDIDRLRKLTDDPSLPVNDRVTMGFALGKMLDDADRFDEAFAAYAKANSLFRASRAAVGERFDSPALVRGVDQLIGEFTPSRFEQVGRVGSSSESPVFIVGMPRSGTSLVEQVAASHPQVFGAGEIKDINRVAGALSSWGHAGGAPHLDTVAASKLANAHVERLAAMSGGAARVIDKMLDNVFTLALIAVLFPASRIIFCHRDARDTCLSCYFCLFPGNIFARDLTECANRWVQTDRLMKHWRKVLPLRMLDVQYEEMVADLEGQSRRLIDFLGLLWDPACLDFHRTQRPVLTSSNWQVRQPLYSKSVGRWRHYQQHLGPMLEILG